jgi:hypothetical protein
MVNVNYITNIGVSNLEIEGPVVHEVCVMHGIGGKGLRKKFRDLSRYLE